MPAEPGRTGWLGLASLVGVGAAGILWATGLIADDPGLALAMPAVAVGATLCARWPAFGVVMLVLLAGASNTLEAFFSVPVAEVRDFLLGGLWIGVIATFLLRPERSPWLWPGLLGVFVYIVLTAIEIPTAPEIDDGIQSFRFAPWMMTATLLVAVAPWSGETRGRIARGIVAVSIAVGAYAVYRKITGPASDELAFAQNALIGLDLSEIRFFASFPTAQHMALFCASLIPFTLALAIVWRGPWRLAAIASLPLLGFQVFASDVRTGIVGAALGVTVTLCLFSLAGAIPSGRRVALVITATAAAVVIGLAAYEVTTANDPDAVARFERILTPGEDPTVEARRDLWDRLLDDAPEYPFGHGLGTSGAVLRGQTRQPIPLDLLFIDSTFVKVAYEQGVAVMLLFCLGLMMLLIALAWRGVTILDRVRAGLALGACGTLAVIAVFFYSSNYIEQQQMIVPWLIIGLGVAAAAPRPSSGSQFSSRSRNTRKSPVRPAAAP